jgi:hypothetical protein
LANGGCNKQELSTEKGAAGDEHSSTNLIDRFDDISVPPCRVVAYQRKKAPYLRSSGHSDQFFLKKYIAEKLMSI